MTESNEKKFSFLYVLFLTIYIYKKKISYLYMPLNILILFLSFQIILGIFTIVLGAHIHIAAVHQVSSIFLVTYSIYFFYINTRAN